MAAERRFTLAKGEMLAINGALFRAPEGARLTVVNDARFLTQAHMLPEEDNATPLRRLYQDIQRHLMANPISSEMPVDLEYAFRRAVREIEDAPIRHHVAEAKGHVRAGRPVEALKTLKRAFLLEA